MTDPRLEIKAIPRSIPSDQNLDTPLYSLAWQATQRWSEKIEQLKESRQAALENENRAWITLADEYFHLQKVYTGLLPALEQSNLNRGARDLSLSIRRLEQALRSHHLEIIAPTGSIYSPELAEVMESVDQISQLDIEESVIQEVLVPAIRRGGQVIRFGKAIIAIPEQDSVSGNQDPKGFRRNL